MGNPAYIVAMAMGVVMLLSVCFVYVRHQTLALGGMSLSAFAVVLLGMSVWRSIDVSVNGQGVQAKLDQAVAAANEARQEVAVVKQATEQNVEATRALKATVETVRAQGALRDLGFYRGAVDGNSGAMTTKSIRDFQAARQLPATGVLDSRTIQALGIKPVPVPAPDSP